MGFPLWTTSPIRPIISFSCAASFLDTKPSVARDVLVGELAWVCHIAASLEDHDGATRLTVAPQKVRLGPGGGKKMLPRRIWDRRGLGPPLWMSPELGAHGGKKLVREVRFAT